MLALGIDLGGTAIKGGLVTSEGKVLVKGSIPTEVNEGKDRVIERICELAIKLVHEGGVSPRDLEGIGIGVPGFVNYSEGKILFAPNLKWQETPLREILEERLRLPTWLDNDVNAAALGERFFGAGKNYEDFIMLTIGTGLGGALLLKGELYRGTLGMAGEIGHMIVELEGYPCGCGQRGCLETFTSATAMLRHAKEQGLKVASTKEVFAIAKDGESRAQEVINRSAYYLALGVANMINILNPEAIIIGGGVSAAGDLLLNPIKENLAKFNLGPAVKRVNIVLAQLGNDAGIVGSSSLLFAAKKD